MALIGLNDDEQMIRDTVNKFVDNINLLLEEHFEAGTFPMELVPTIADMGLLGMHLDGYGCAGASAMAYGIGARELEAGDSGLRSFVSVQGSLCMFPIWKYGSEEQRGMATEDGRGRSYWMLRSGPSLTTAQILHRWQHVRPNETVTNGFSTVRKGGSPMQALHISPSSGPTPMKGSLGFSYRQTRGFEARKIQNKLSLRASVTGEFYMDDVVVPRSMRLPDAMSIGAPLSCLSEARYGIAFGAVEWPEIATTLLWTISKNALIRQTLSSFSDQSNQIC